MRFMVIVKASKDTEAGVMPSTELLTAMGKFNEEMVKAGVMEAGEGLHPTAKGARIRYQNRQSSVSNGPFALSGDSKKGQPVLRLSLTRQVPIRAPDDRKHLPRIARGLEGTCRRRPIPQLVPDRVGGRTFPRDRRSYGTEMISNCCWFTLAQLH